MSDTPTGAMPPEELLLTVAATMTREEMNSMISSTKLCKLIDDDENKGDSDE